jgi:hypothetical protein
MRRLIPILAVALSAACSNGLEKQSHVSKLRVLAVRADPPEVVLAPGEPAPSVQLTALAVEPGGAPVEVRFALCQAVGLPSAGLDCPGRDTLVALPATSPTSALLDPAGIPFEPPDPGAVVPLVIGFRAESAGESLHGFATLNVRTSADPTPVRNPSVVALQADGAALPENGSGTVRAGATVHLTPVADQDPVVFSFYSTAGDLDALRATAASSEVDWTAPGEAGPVQLWIVARDGRGGVGWLARTVQVVP